MPEMDKRYYYITVPLVSCRVVSYALLLSLVACGSVLNSFELELLGDGLSPALH